jgi:hypothetical protein
MDPILILGRRTTPVAINVRWPGGKTESIDLDPEQSEIVIAWEGR